jgi:hypothetical protein
MSQIDWERPGDTQTSGTGWFRPHLQLGSTESPGEVADIVRDRANRAAVESESLVEFVCR